MRDGRPGPAIPMACQPAQLSVVFVTPFPCPEVGPDGVLDVLILEHKTKILPDQNAVGARTDATVVALRAEFLVDAGEGHHDTPRSVTV